MSRYTREQILNALYPLLEDSFGIDPDEKPLPGEPIDAHLKRMDVWHDSDLFDLFRRCEKTFGFKVTPAEWKAFFEGGAADAADWERNVAPRMTYEALADFVIDRTRAISFEPVEIAGRRCGPAGAFYGICEAAGQVLLKVERFAPSSSILRHLGRSRVETLWERLSWDRLDALPPLRRCWSDRFASGVFLWDFAMGAVGAAFLCAGEPDLTLLFAAFASLLLVPYLVLRRLENPLPNGIVTFGDLARRLAEVGVGQAAALPDGHA